MTNNGAGLGVEVDLHAALGKIEGRVGGMQAQLERFLAEELDRYAVLANSFSTSTSVSTVIPLRPQVPVGRTYDLRLLTICPNPLVVSHVLTPVTVDVALFVGSQAGGAVGSQYRDSWIGSSIPVTATYGREEMLVRGGDHIYLVFGKTSAAADVAITAVCGDSRSLF